MAVQTEEMREGPLPTGTVTFLFSDIEGSTDRWERYRVGMQDAVRRHDGLMRNAIEQHDGHVFKVVGDAFCAVFERPEDAVAAALEAQFALEREDFSAVGDLVTRMALHTGTTEERGGDYYGPTVNRVARLLGIGHGGQVLVSGVATDLVQGTLPPQATLKDLGPHRLRDLTRPEQVYQLLAPGLRVDFPPLRSLQSLPNNLPLQLTSFVGRDSEVAHIEALLKKHRVVTLVGSGGVGKTRASLQAGANLLDGSGDGVWFVEFAPIVDESLVPNAVAEALGVELPNKSEPLAALVAALKSKHLLLILDNCEHLVAAAARVADAIVRGCPRIIVLASSRQGLGIAGEATYRMPSLGVPAAGVAQTAAEVTRHGAVALFVERAEATDPHFVVTDENAGAIGEICRRLDGIPLAIELAAARVRMLTPQQLQRRLDERFRILTGGSRTALPRQQTLRALVDWSYDLLDEREQTLFCRTGIFVDGFTLEAANVICTDATIDDLDLFDLLSSLVDKSLVIADMAGVATRYRLLESTRAYALEKLAEGRARERFAERHLSYFNDLAQRGYAAHLSFIDRPYESAGLQFELENVRSALTWSLAGGDARTGARAFVSLFSWTRLLTAELVAWSERFLEALDSSDARLQAELHRCYGHTLAGQGRSARAEEELAKALELARAAEDEMVLFDVITSQLQLYQRIQRLDEVERSLAEMETLATAGLSAQRRYRLTNARALAAGLRGDFDAAAGFYSESHTFSRDHGNEASGLSSLLNRAEFEHARGDTELAIDLLDSSLARSRQLLDRETLANVLANKTGYCVALDRLEDAASSALEALALIATIDPGAFLVLVTVEHIALVLALSGRIAVAARLAGYTDATITKTGMQREDTERRTRARLTSTLSVVPEDELARLTREGAELSAEAAVAEAIAAIREQQSA